MSERPTFIYVLKLIDPQKFCKMTSKDEAILEKHFSRLKKAQTNGKLVLAGPTLDGAFGIVIFKAKNKRQAEQYMINDPAVKHKLMTAQLYPFRVSLLAGSKPS